MHSDRRHILYEAGRDNSVDNGIFIHAVVPSHVETVVLLSDKKIDGHINIDLDVEKLEDKSVASK